MSNSNPMLNVLCRLHKMIIFPKLYCAYKDGENINFRRWLGTDGKHSKDIKSRTICCVLLPAPTYNSKIESCRIHLTNEPWDGRIIQDFPGVTTTQWEESRVPNSASLYLPLHSSLKLNDTIICVLFSCTFCCHSLQLPFSTFSFSSQAIMVHF